MKNEFSGHKIEFLNRIRRVTTYTNKQHEKYENSHLVYNNILCFLGH